MPLLMMDMPTISEIESGLFIGDFASSSQLSTLTNNNITAIVSLANNKSEIWSRPENRQLVPEDCHMFVCCADSPSQDLLGQLADICDFIDKHSAGNGLNSVSGRSPNQNTSGDGQASVPSQSNVLVHCTAGVSRSATIVVAYLMRKHRQKLQTVLKHVKEKRRIEPSENFIDQLQIWEEVGYDVWEDTARTSPKQLYRDFLERKAARAAAKARYRRDSAHSEL